MFIPTPEDDKDGSMMAEIQELRLKIKQALQNLDGLTLQSIKVQKPAFDAVLTFNGGVKIHFFSTVFSGNKDSSVNWRHWGFYTPDGLVLIIGPGTDWSVKKYRKKAK